MVKGAFPYHSSHFHPGLISRLIFCIYFASEYWITAKTCLKIWYSFKFEGNLHQTSAKRFVYLQQNLSFLQLPCLSNSGSVNSDCYLVKMIIMINDMIIILMDIVHTINYHHRLWQWPTNEKEAFLLFNIIMSLRLWFWDYRDGTSRSPSSSSRWSRSRWSASRWHLQI